MRLSPILAMIGCVAYVSSVHAADQRFTVSEIVIEGCKNVHQDRVRFIISTRAGKQMDPSTIADDVRAIERMGPFTDTHSELRFAEAPATTVAVVFHVTELPYVSAVLYGNLTYFQQSGLDKVIETKPGGYLNPQFIENDRRAIQRHFQDKGYRNVAVTSESPVVSGSAIVTFWVDLGREIEVGRVIYTGLPPHALPRNIDKALINQIGRPYQPDLIMLDEGSVARALQDLGYLDAVVQPAMQDWYDFVRPYEERSRHGPTLAFDGRYNDRVVVTFPVVSGELWHLGSVSFVGNTVASEEELRKAFSLPDGSDYKRVDIEKALERARRLISNQGYARADIRVDRRPDPDQQLMHLTLHVFEGDLYTLSRVDIYGNYQTKDAIVRRAMQIKPGDLWNDDKIDESKRQIQRTGLFKSDPQRPLRLSPRYNDDEPGSVDLIVDVDEDSTGSMRFQLGYSSAFGVFGEATYTERNFDLLAVLTGQGWRGAGHILEISGYGSEDRTSFGVSWTNPHIFDGPYSLLTAANRSDSRVRDWEEVRLNGSVGIGRSFLKNDLKLNVTYSYTDLKIDDVQADAPDDAINGTGHYFLNSLQFDQTFDQLDNPRFPTRGYRLGLTENLVGEIMSSSTDYAEFGAKADVFVPMYTAESGGITFFRLSQRWRQLEPVGDSTEVPFYDRYYGGGPAPKHRGFDNGKLGPREINMSNFEALTGGTVDYLATAEASFPLQGTNEGLRLILFSDYGNVWNKEESLTISDMRTAIGFGVRFPIQLPVALDFAFLLDSQDNEADSQIHFSLGFFSF
jgi:outer membrane protein assembly complex protein YaeT